MNLWGVESGQVSEIVGLVKGGTSALQGALGLAKSFREQFGGSGSSDGGNSEELFAARSLALDLAGKLMDAQMAQMEILSRLNALERSILEAQKLQDRRSRYEIITTPAGAKVMALKTEHYDTEAAHNLCPACYDNEKFQILQPSGNYGQLLECPSCKAIYRHG